MSQPLSNLSRVCIMWSSHGVQVGNLRARRTYTDVSADCGKHHCCFGSRHCRCETTFNPSFIFNPSFKTHMLCMR